MYSQGAQSGPLSALPSLIPSTLRLRIRAIEKRELKIKCPDKVVEKEIHMTALLLITFLKCTVTS